jgi:hypothetical protein
MFWSPARVAPTLYSMLIQIFHPVWDRHHSAHRGTFQKSITCGYGHCPTLQVYSEYFFFNVERPARRLNRGVQSCTSSEQLVGSESQAYRASYVLEDCCDLPSVAFLESVVPAWLQPFLAVTAAVVAHPPRRRLYKHDCKHDNRSPPIRGWNTSLVLVVNTLPTSIGNCQQ